MPVYTKELSLPDGRTITLETGKLARQAQGAVVLKLGNTMLLATVGVSKEPKADASFLPLFVDYQEKFAGAGRIPGGFLKEKVASSIMKYLPPVSSTGLSDRFSPKIFILKRRYLSK